MKLAIRLSLLAPALLAIVLSDCGRAPGGARRIRMPAYTEKELAAAQPLEVRSAVPQGLVSSEDESREILVSFSDPLVTLGEDSARQDFPILFKPDIPGKVRWLGTRILSFQPDTTPTRATEYEVRLPKGIKSLTGQMLKQDYTFKFQTLRPSLQRSRPYSGARLVGPKEPIFLAFNQPMNPARAGRSIQLRTTHGPARFSLRGMTKTDESRFPMPEYEYSDEEGAPSYNPDDLSRVLVLEPQGGLRPNELYTVVLQTGLPGRDGNLGLPSTSEIQFWTLHDFRFADLADADGMAPDDGLGFNFSNPVQVGELVRNVTFDPNVEIPPEYASQTYGDSLVRLSLPLQPETRYTVKISGNLKDKFNNRLGRDASREFRTGSYRPSVSMSQGNSIIEASGNHYYPVRMLNIDSLDLGLGRLGDDDVIDLLSPSYSYSVAARDSILDRVITTRRIWHPKLVRNQRAVLPVDLGEALAGSPFGFVALRLGDFYLGNSRINQRTVSEWRERAYHAVSQVTNMGISGKFSPENNLIMVTNLADARPVAGAQVELKDDSKHAVWSGLTDENGLVETPGWASLWPKAQAGGASDEGDDEEGDYRGRHPEFWVFAGKENGDRAFLGSGWGTGIHPYDFEIPYDWNPNPNQPEGFIFTEKGLYHAGDTVHLKGLIREKRHGAWVLPEIETCSLVVEDPNSAPVLAKRLAITQFGSVEQAVALPSDAATGGYDVRIDYGRERFYASFQVEAYRPVEFTVKVSSPKPEYLANERFEGTVFAKYLFGAPLAGERATWSLMLSPYYFRAPAFSDFDFQGESPEQRYLDNGAGEDVSPGEHTLARGAGRLDKDGKLQIGAKLDLKGSKQSMVLAAEATVTGPNQRDVSGSESFIVHLGEFYIGTKLKSYFLHDQEPIEFQLITVGTDGKLKSDQGVQVECYRRDWQSVRKAGFGGRYQWISKPQDKLVATQKVTTGSAPSTVKFTVKEPGTYVVKCQARDSKGNKLFHDLTCYVSGYGRAGWEMRDDDRLELVRDRMNYKPGDVARILVKSPYDSCRALVTVEREFVMDKFVLDLKGNAPSVEIPIKSEYLPNVYVSVMLIKGRTADTGTRGEGRVKDEDEDVGKPGFKIGYVTLPVSSEEKRLKVNVHPDHDDYRPGDEAELDVQVVGHDGGGAQAEVTLAVVDLGVLELIGYQTPDPFARFYQSRPLSVATAESRLHVLGQRSYGEKGENHGGGGGEQGTAYRSKFLETAYYLPSLQTDADGNAHVRFKLPDNLTTFKIMAVAQNGDRFGNGDSSFTVSKPLVLQGSLPMFVRDGDEFDAGVVAYNNSHGKGTVAIKASVENAELVGDATSTIALAPQTNHEFRFHYRVTPGKAANPVFAFSATMATSSDAVKLSIPRRNPALTEAFAVYEQTDSEADQVLARPKNARPGIGGVQFTLASSGLVGLQPSLRYLREYPYECLEQKLSRALPFIAAEDLINKFRLSDLASDTLRQYVNNVLKQVGRYQTAGGAFRFWDDESESNRPSSWLSAYCMSVLVRAREHGYAVNEAVVNQGLAYLRGLLSEPDAQWPETYCGRSCLLATRAFIAYVLTRYNENVGGYLQPLYEKRDSLPLFAKAYLLKALANQPGWQEPVAELTREFMNQIKYAPTTAHFEEGDNDDYYWTFSSNARTTAVILQALLEAHGAWPDAEKIVRWLLLERKNGCWRTTQENVYAFDAFATYFRIYEHETPDFTATVEAAMKNIVNAKFSGYSLGVRTDTLALTQLFPGPDTLVPVRVAKAGTGRLYYGIRMTYAPAGDLPPRTEGLLVRKEISDLSGRFVTGFERGQIYRVTLKVYTPEERLFVALDDPLPAGLEVMNTNFQTTSQRLIQKLYRIRNEGGIRWWGSFDHEEIYADRYRLFATTLNEGVHSFTYLAKALTSGTFSMPPTKAEEMYTPEVFGFTGARVVTVK